MINNSQQKFQNLPGWEIVSFGLEDIESGKHETIKALLVYMAASRLCEIGFDVPKFPFSEDPFQIKVMIFQKLSENYPDEHNQFNAMQQRLAKFCDFAERITHQSSN